MRDLVLSAVIGVLATLLITQHFNRLGASDFQSTPPLQATFTGKPLKTTTDPAAAAAAAPPPPPVTVEEPSPDAKQRDKIVSH